MSDELHPAAIKALIAFKSHRKEVNILLFGESNVGKSSFINLLTTMMSPQSDRTVKSPAQARALHHNGENCTLLFSGYKIPGTCISLWDTKGWKAGGTYSESTFGKLLDGAIPDQVPVEDMHL